MSIDKIVEVSKLGNELMGKYGLVQQGWTFHLDSAKQRVGQCRYDDKEIGLSLAYIRHTPMAELEDTIRHEIAHAIVGSNVPSHGEEWKEACLTVGARPQRLADEVAKTTAKPNYKMVCPSCGREWLRYRMRRRNFGSKCPDCKVEVEIYKAEGRLKECWRQYSKIEGQK